MNTAAVKLLLLFTTTTLKDYQNGLTVDIFWWYCSDRYTRNLSEMQQWLLLFDWAACAEWLGSGHDMNISVLRSSTEA